ncbi:CAP domain-containing protein [Henriciella sp. AS95]|uniref:CAP domain-containing protein n=1 Tax=Henriciella sp. AS95 TaxID=3135782 RepID=UPI00317C3227
MIGKARILAALFALVPLGAHAICDASIDARSTDLPDYVLSGQACLAEPPDGYSFDGAFEAEIVDLINEERRAHDLPALPVRIELRDAARWHSLDMAANDFFAHVSMDERLPAARITAFDRTLLSSIQRENIAAITGHVDWETAIKSLHDGLMDSPGHRKAILADDVNQLAIGIVTAKNGIWLTELFVKQDGAFEQPVPLRLAAGTLIDQPATIEDWEWSGLALRQGGKVNDLKTRRGARHRIPASADGVYALTVRGEKPGPTPDSCRYMHFSGPRVEIVPKPAGSS